MFNLFSQVQLDFLSFDIEKGFIRAEVVSFEDMIRYEGRVGAREVGKARSEGRDYPVQDGDVILFYHN